MDNLKTYADFVNENIFHAIRRLGYGSRPDTKYEPLGRYKDDKYAKKIFQEILDDFEKSGRNFKKVHITENTLTYEFKKFGKDEEWRIGSGNKEALDMEVKINAINITGAMMEIEKYLANPKYDPNHRMKFGFDRNEGPITQEDRDKWRIFNREEEIFFISRDLARKMIKYFRKLFIEKYPQLKNNKYLNKYTIQEIEKYGKPILGHVDKFAKNKVECIFSYFDLEEKSKYENWIENSYAVKGKTKDGYHVTWCYPPPAKKEIDKEIDPYGEEEWGEEEEAKIIEWLSTITHKEYEEKIKKTINEY